MTEILCRKLILDMRPEVKAGHVEDMEYYLYIDVVFFMNLIMDVIVLNTVRKLLRVQTSAFRIVSGSIAGALWACILAVYPILPVFFEMFLTYVVMGCLMVKIALRTKGTRELIKGVLGLYLASVTLGGTMYALYQHTRVGFYVEQLIRGHPIEGMPFLIFVLLAVGAYLGVKYLYLNLLESRRVKGSLYEVTLSCGEKTLKTTGLLDTGNHLYEPISHRPVHVADSTVFEALYRENDPFLLIPYHTIGTEEGMMPGIWIDSMEITGEEGKNRIIRPLIARSPHPLTRDGSYGILLHEEQD